MASEAERSHHHKDHSPDAPRPPAIIIVTHDRYEKLRNLLRSLSSHPSQYLKSVVVVDDSTVKETLDGFSNIKLTHLILPERVFITRAKNIGWRKANEELVYFIDDDNVLDETSLEPMVRTMSLDPALGALVPAVLYKSKPDLVWVYATPLSPDRWRHILVGRNLLRNRALEGRLLETDALANASLVRREALAEVGGFDEALRINSSADLARRLKAAGWKVYSFTGSFLFHDVLPPGKLGWWAAHGSADAERVRYEIRDWFILMRRLHPTVKLYRPRATVRSLGFVGPNMFAYLLTGRGRRIELAASVIRGFVEGIAAARKESAL